MMRKPLFRTFGRERANSVVVLASGGIDSSVLLAIEADKGRRVQPVFLAAGFCFEAAHEEALRRFIRKIGKKNIDEMVRLPVSVEGFFPKNHWALTGKNIPPFGSPEGSCYLPGWNLLLLAPTLIFAAQEGIPSIALGHIAHNPYPDGQPSFFRLMESVGHRAFGRKIRIKRPFEKLGKSAVLKRGFEYPLGLTLTCINPVKDKHCGRCHKCAERHRGFFEAGLVDPTTYAASIRL